MKVESLPPFVLRIVDRSFHELADVEIRCRFVNTEQYISSCRYSYRKKTAYLYFSACDVSAMSTEAAVALVVHELVHVVRLKKSTLFKAFIHGLRFMISKEHRKVEEAQVQMDVLARGYARETIALYAFNNSRYCP